MQKKRISIQIAFVIFMLSIWQFCVKLKVYPEAIFPSIGQIFDAFIRLLKEDALLSKAGNSLLSIVFSVGISFIFAFILVFLSKRFVAMEAIIGLLAAVASPLPGIAILPIVILWIGLNQTAMYFVMIHAMIWPIYTILFASVLKLDQRYSRLMTTFRMCISTRLIHVYLQGALPDIIGALEVAWGRGWRALISVEMIFGIAGRSAGLGWLIYERRMYMDTAGMLAGLAVVAACGALLEGSFRKLKHLGVYYEDID